MIIFSFAIYDFMQSVLSFILGLIDYISVGINSRNLYGRFLLIIFANLLPVFGILIFDWPLFYLLILYWCETALVGIFNIGKILLIGIRPGVDEGFFVTLIGTLGGVFVSVFFTFYYGIFLFMAFIFTMTVAPIEASENEDSFSLESLGDILREFFYIPSWNSPLLDFIDNGFIILILMIASLSNEFYNVYYKKKEYLNMYYSEQIRYPFPRILALLFTVFLGGLIGSGFALLIPSLRNLGMVLVWMVIKFFVDIHFLARE